MAPLALTGGRRIGTRTGRARRARRAMAGALLLELGRRLLVGRRQVAVRVGEALLRPVPRCLGRLVEVAGLLGDLGPLGLYVPELGLDFRLGLPGLPGGLRLQLLDLGVEVGGELL